MKCVLIVVAASNQMKWYANEPEYFIRDFALDDKWCVFDGTANPCWLCVRQCNIRVYHRHCCLDCRASTQICVIQCWIAPWVVKVAISISERVALTRMQTATYNQRTIHTNTTTHLFVLESTWKQNDIFEPLRFHSFVSGFYHFWNWNVTVALYSFFFPSISFRQRFMTSVNSNVVSFYCASIWWWSDTYKMHIQNIHSSEQCKCHRKQLGFAIGTREWEEGWRCLLFIVAFYPWFLSLDSGFPSISIHVH